MNIWNKILFKALVWKFNIFVILLSHDGFKCDPEANFQTITSKSQSRSSHMQMFFKIGVLKSFTQVFSREYCKIFKNSVFMGKLWWLLFSVWWSNCSALSICRPSPLNQKHNVGEFLQKRFADLFRVRYIISGNHSTRFC